jgi:hypothetical protein
MAIKSIMLSLSQRSKPIQSLYVKSILFAPDVVTIFDRARKLAPCLLVLGNFDCIQAPLRKEILEQIDKSENDGILMVVTSTDCKLEPTRTD